MRFTFSFISLKIIRFSRGLKSDHAIFSGSTQALAWQSPFRTWTCIGSDPSKLTKYNRYPLIQIMVGISRLLQRHRIAEIAFLVGHAATIETDKLGILNQMLDLLNLVGGRQHTKVTGMPMLMFAVFSFFNHRITSFFGSLFMKTSTLIPSKSSRIHAIYSWQTHLLLRRLNRCEF